MTRNEYEKALRQRNPEYVERQRKNSKEWHRANRDRVLVYQKKRMQDPVKRHMVYLNKRSNMLKKYGLTIDDYQQMFNNQNGICLICDRKFLALDVDHCHITTKVRGLLCRACNLLVGHVENRADHIRKAFKYLEGFNG